MSASTLTKEYLSAADTAALIRAKLHRTFPGVKFWVRAQHGLAVDVRYDGRTGYAPLKACYCHGLAPEVDSNYGSNQCRRCGYLGRLEPIYRDGAPTAEEVRAVVEPYSGGSFDGMIDMEYSTTVLLDKFGDVVGSRSTGTEQSLGSVPGWDDTDTYRAATTAVRAVSTVKYLHVDAEAPYGAKVATS